jgi:hypothetical protein
MIVNTPISQNLEKKPPCLVEKVKFIEKIQNDKTYTCDLKKLLVLFFHGKFLQKNVEKKSYRFQKN